MEHDQAWEFYLPLPPRLLSLNSRLHWAQRHRVTARLRESLALMALAERSRQNVGRCPREHRRVELTVLRGRGQRLLDPDNLHGAIKVPLDALRDANWIWDDSARWLELTVRQVRDRQRGPGLHVRIIAGPGGV